MEDLEYWKGYFYNTEKTEDAEDTEGVKIGGTWMVRSKAEVERGDLINTEKTEGAEDAEAADYDKNIGRECIGRNVIE